MSGPPATGSGRLLEVDEPQPSCFADDIATRIALDLRVAALGLAASVDWAAVLPMRSGLGSGAPPQYSVVAADDRGPAALEVTVPRRLLKDADPLDELAANDVFTPPESGYPRGPSASARATSPWALQYVEALAEAAGTREAALRRFWEAFADEASRVAILIVRKTALMQLNRESGLPLVSSAYASTVPAVQQEPRVDLFSRSEDGAAAETAPSPPPSPSPSPSQTNEKDAGVTPPPPLFLPVDPTAPDAAPHPQLFAFNGVQYEIVNNRARIAQLGESHEAALRFAAHRWQGLAAVAAQPLPFMHHLPALLVEYSGFRVWCSAIAPLSGAPPVYGSVACGGEAKGDPYMRSDAQAVAAMQRLARGLNLKGHHCGTGPSRQFLYTNGDLAVHRGVDNRLYVVSGTERLVPPVRTNCAAFANGYLYRRFRPELVKSSCKARGVPMPISSDVFSNFGLVRAEEHEREAALLTEALRAQVAPDAADRMLAVLRGVTSLPHAVATLNAAGGVSALLHRHGVNIRLIGDMTTRLSARYYKLRAKQLTADTADMLVPIAALVVVLRLEIIARAAKLVVRRLMRNRCWGSIVPFLVGALRVPPPVRDAPPQHGIGGAVSEGATVDAAPETVTETAAAAARGTPGSPMERVEALRRQREQRRKARARGRRGRPSVVTATATVDGDTHIDRLFHNCFARLLWPVIDAKFGWGEQVALMEFAPASISINSHLDCGEHVATTYVLQHLCAATGVCFSRSVRPNAPVCEVGELAAAIDSTAAFGTVRCDIVAVDPAPVIRTLPLPPVVYPNGERMHIVGVARSYVRAIAAGIHQGRLDESIAPSTMRLADQCAQYCREAGLANDEDVAGWLARRNLQVAALDTALLQAPAGARPAGVTEAARTGQPPASDEQSTRCAARPSAARSAVDFCIAPHMIVHMAQRRGEPHVVRLSIDPAKLAELGVEHGQMVELTKGASKGRRGFVLGIGDGHLYITENADHIRGQSTTDAAAPDNSKMAMAQARAGPPHLKAIAVLGKTRDELQALSGLEVVPGCFGEIAYYDPAELLGYEEDVRRRREHAERAEAERLRAARRMRTGSSGFTEEELEAAALREQVAREAADRVSIIIERPHTCYFFSAGWHITSYCTDPAVLDTVHTGLRHGVRVLLRTTGETCVVIGEKRGEVWACVERTDALPRVLTVADLASMRVLHMRGAVQYNEERLVFQGEEYHRSLSALGKFGMYFGQKVLFRSGFLAGMIGIVLGSSGDSLYLFNMRSREICRVPGRNRREIDDVLQPVLLGCVLDLNVFTPAQERAFTITTASGATVAVDQRGAVLLPRFGVLRGTRIEVLLGPLATRCAVVLGCEQKRLWVKLEDAEGVGAVPLAANEFVALADHTEQHHSAVANGPGAPRSGAAAAAAAAAARDPFVFLAASGAPRVFDRHDDTCGPFGVFHGQRLIVARDLYDQWLRFTVIGVLDGELWAVEDGKAAATPLLGSNSTEMQQLYSVLDVAGHFAPREFRDWLQIPGTPILPATRHFTLARESVVYAVLRESLQLIGLDARDASIAACCGPEFEPELRSGAEMVVVRSRKSYRVRRGGPDAAVHRDEWHWREITERFVVWGCYGGSVYAAREGEVGVATVAASELCGGTVTKQHTLRSLSADDVVAIEDAERTMHIARMRKRQPAVPRQHQRLAPTAPTAPTFPPADLPTATREELERCIPFVPPAALHELERRLLRESGIPDAKVRLVMHWMLTWFGLGLDFRDTRHDGVVKLAALQEFVLRAPLPIPMEEDYDRHREQCEAQRATQEASWGVSADRLNELKRDAYSFAFLHARDGPEVSRQLRSAVFASPLPSGNSDDPARRGASATVLPPISTPTRATGRAGGPDVSPSSAAIADASAAFIIGEGGGEGSAVPPSSSSSSSVDVAAEASLRVALEALRQAARMRHAVRKVVTRGAPTTSTAAAPAGAKEPQHHRYKSIDGVVLHFDSSDAALRHVFGVRRGDILRYNGDTDMEGVHCVVLGVLEGKLWRYEHRVDGSPVFDEHARAFCVGDAAQLQRLHPHDIVGTTTPREGDPFWFPRHDGPLMRLDIDDAACGAFGVVHGQRFVANAPPSILAPLPRSTHKPIITALGSDGVDIYFTMDGSGAFTHRGRDPVSEMQLEPLYRTTVAGFTDDRGAWFPCPAEFVRRGKTSVQVVSVDTTPELLQLWGAGIVHGALVRLGEKRSVAAVRGGGGGGERQRERRRLPQVQQPPDADAPKVEFIEAVIVGVRHGRLYRSLLSDEVAQPMTDAEFQVMTIVQRPDDVAEAAAMEALVDRKLRQLREWRSFAEPSEDAGSNLVQRPPPKFKAFDSFGHLCLFDVSDEATSLFGFAHGTLLECQIAGRVRRCVVVGVRNDLLWKIGADDAIVQAAVSPASCSSAGQPTADDLTPRLPVVTMFHGCSCRADLESKFKAVAVGTVVLRSFTG